MLAEQIIASLQKLDGADLRRVRDEAGGLLQFASGGVGRGQDWLLLGLLSELKSRGEACSPSQAVVCNTYKTYQEKAPRIKALLEHHIAGMRENEKLLVGELAAQALAAHITDYKPVSLRTMLASVDEIPEALDNAFPGYMAAGMLSFMIRSRTKHVTA